MRVTLVCHLCGQTHQMHIDASRRKLADHLHDHLCPHCERIGSYSATITGP